MRQIYMVRHAEAERGARSGLDEDRALTRAGHETAERVGLRLAELRVHPELVLVSPVLRARQTAAALGNALGVSVEEWAALAPGVPHETIAAELSSRHRMVSVALVGHEPDCGELVSYFLTGTLGQVRVRFGTCTVACLSADGLPPESRALLEWIVPSAVMVG